MTGRVGGVVRVRLSGHESWELDALDPTVLGDLIAEHIESVRDDQLYDHLADQEQAERAALARISDHYDHIAATYGTHPQAQDPEA